MFLSRQEIGWPVDAVWNRGTWSRRRGGKGAAKRPPAEKGGGEGRSMESRSYHPKKRGC